MKKHAVVEVAVRHRESHFAQGIGRVDLAEIHELRTFQQAVISIIYAGQVWERGKRCENGRQRRLHYGFFHQRFHLASDRRRLVYPDSGLQIAWETLGKTIHQIANGLIFRATLIDANLLGRQQRNDHRAVPHRRALNFANGLRKLDRANVVWRIVKNFSELMRQHSPTSGHLFPASLNQRRLMFRACTNARQIVIKTPPGTAARLNLVSGTARTKPKIVELAGHLQRVSPAPFMREICAQQQLRWPWSTNQPDQRTDISSLTGRILSGIIQITRQILDRGLNHRKRTIATIDGFRHLPEVSNAINCHIPYYV